MPYIAPQQLRRTGHCANTIFISINISDKSQSSKIIEDKVAFHALPVSVGLKLTSSRYLVLPKTSSELNASPWCYEWIGLDWMDWMGAIRKRAPYVILEKSYCSNQ